MTPYIEALLLEIRHQISPFDIDAPFYLPRPVAMEEITTLDHEILNLQPMVELGFRSMASCGAAGTYDSVKLATFVPLWVATWVFTLTGTELTEVFCCLGDNVRKKLHFDPAKRLS